MKALALLALAGVSCMAVAEEQSSAPANTQESLEVERYEYAMDLDIAHVIKSPDIPNVCGVVPVQMTYEDHQGKRHILEYRVVGKGCQNG
ncbi:DUF2790 domain-containing protein [Azotobacter vinelandii]|uniref:DUF2790 domain-containing protein n=1 Tax=Azotobacter vinelandii TaxID=354 RepID=UPI000773D8E8|nr:DUF2790 domain-containing protein [Azotobacter vinelandii]